MSETSENQRTESVPSRKVECDSQANYSVGRATVNVRAGWEESMKKMAANGDDRIFLEEINRPTEWEANEWNW